MEHHTNARRCQGRVFLSFPRTSKARVTMTTGGNLPPLQDDLVPLEDDVGGVSLSFSDRTVFDVCHPPQHPPVPFLSFLSPPTNHHPALTRSVARTGKGKGDARHASTSLEQASLTSLKRRHECRSIGSLRVGTTDIRPRVWRGRVDLDPV